MMSPLDKQLLLPAVLLFFAAIIFTGGPVWHDMVGGQYVQQTAQQSATGPNGAINPAPVGAVNAPPSFSSITASEGAIPHYPAGNIDGAVTSVSGNSLTIAVIPPGSTSPGPVKATVIIDSDTQIDKTSDSINSLTLKDLTVGEQINVLPKVGSVQGTTLHAQTIMPLNLATSTPPATQ
jgi:hypothetical protein